MSEQLKEALSAALDNEADEFELRRVLDEAGRDESLRETFERYQLIQAVMRGDANTRTVTQRAQLQRRVRVAMDVDVETAVVEHSREADAEIVPAGRSVWMTRVAAFVAAFGTVLAVYLGAGKLLPGAAESTGPGNEFAQGALPALTTPVINVKDEDSLIAGEAVPELSEQDQEVRQRHGRWIAAHDAAVKVIDPPSAENLVQHAPSGWQVAWLPEGFEAIPSRSMTAELPQASIQRYGDGERTFSLIVEAASSTSSLPAESHAGKYWVVERVVGEDPSGTDPHLAAVVGELSPPAARRLLGSISIAK